MYTQEAIETLSNLSSMQAVLDKVKPVKELYNFDFLGNGGALPFLPSRNQNISPFAFLLNIFKTTATYDQMIEWLSKFLVNTLPAFEIATKGAILAGFKSMAVCNADPRIPAKYRLSNRIPDNGSDDDLSSKVGFFMDVDAMDFRGMLGFSPLKEEGTPFYFGTHTVTLEPAEKKWEDYNIAEVYAFQKYGKKAYTDKKIKKYHFVEPYTLTRAEDFNAFLWFVMNKAYFPTPLIIDRSNGKALNVAIREALHLSDEDTLIIRKRHTQEGGSYETENASDGSIFAGDFEIITNKPIAVGTAAVEKVDNNTRSCVMLCRSVSEKKNNDNTTTYDSLWNVVSIDNFSATWYTDPANYYAYNLSMPKAKKKPIDYNNGKGVCNIKYLRERRPSNLLGITTNNMVQVRILPKPFTALVYDETPNTDFTTQCADWDKTIPSVSSAKPRLVRALFNENGEADPDGHFSMPQMEPLIIDPITQKCVQVVKAFLTNATMGADNLLRDGFEAVAYMNYFSTYCARAKGLIDELAMDEKMHMSNYLIHTNDHSGYFQGDPFDSNRGKLLVQAMTDEFDSNGRVPVTSAFINFSGGSFAYGDLEDAKQQVDQIYCAFCAWLREAEQHANNYSESPLSFYQIYQKGESYLYINRVDGSYFLSDVGPNGHSLDDVKAGIGSPKATQYLMECYPGITVYEFNYDFVMGMKMFDAKVLAVSLVDAIFNMNIGLDTHIPSRHDSDTSSLIRQIITDVLNTEETTELKDCFFTFSNEVYDNMLHTTELEYLKRRDIYNSSRRSRNVDTEKLIEIINGYDSYATMQEQTEVLTRFFKEASISYSDNDEASETDKFHMQVNFANDLIGALAGVIIEAIMTPKIVMAYNINNELMGGNVGYIRTFEEFIRAFRNVIVGIVRELRNIIMKELLRFALNLLKPLISLFSVQLAKETYEIYKDLLKHLLDDCLPNIGSYLRGLNFWRGKATILDTTLPEVTYADIESGTTPTLIDNC